MNDLAPRVFERSYFNLHFLAFLIILTVDLTDGCTISVPLAWYPRLLHGKPQERSNWHFIGKSEGIHWPDLDEDLSIEGIILGRPSAESSRSFQRWLDERTK